MAAAGEGPSSGYGGNGGGAGGKFRKRPFRRAAHTTPYDRPPAPGNPSWLSKIVVEPASRLIASSAQRFFAPLFRKRLPPPPPPPEVHQVSSNERAEVVERAEVQEAAVRVNTNPISDDVSDLERVFKKKTFTRSEIDHLTELLQSRAEDESRKSDIRTEADHEKLVADSERQKWYSSPLAGKSTLYDSSPGLNVTPASSTRVLEEDIASPAEIAKAYMGNQASRISPSMLGLRTRAVREEANLLRNVPYTPKSSVTPMSTKGLMSTKGSHGEGPGNGFATPRSLGRSAIYSMARAPYSRVHPTAFRKERGSRSGFGGPLPALSLNEQHGELGNRTALKRRSSVLDDDLGSIGPMRRTRQKPSMLSHNTFHQGIESSSARQRTLMDERAQRSSKLGGENDDLQTSRTSYGHVPPHSTRMAEKIFEHIEYMASKPKSKSPAKLTTDMLRGQALKSLEDADSSKLLYNNHVHNSSGSPSKRRVSPKEKERTEDIISQKLDSQNDVSTPGNGDTKTLVTCTSTSEASCFVAKADGQHPPKKQGFTMNFDEDLDDDNSCDGPTFEVLPNVNSNQDKQNSAAVEKSFPDKLPVFPDNRMPLESVSGKRSDLDGVDSVKAVGLSLSAPSTLFTAPPTSLEFDSTKQASNKFLGSDPVSNPAGPEPWSYMLPNPDRILPESAKGGENCLAEAAKTNGKMDNSPPSVPSSSTSTCGISPSFPIPAQHQPAAIPSFLSTPASTGIMNSFHTNGTGNIASSSSASSSSATTLFSAASVDPKTTFVTESAGNSSITALNAEVHAPKTGKESSAENSNSTAFATPGTQSGNFGLSKSSTAASLGKDSLSSSNGGPLLNAHTSVAGSGAGSVSSMAQVQFAPSFAFGSSPAVAIVPSGPSFSSPSLSETKPFSSSSAATPGIFSFSAKAPSSETNVTSSNSNSSPFGTTASVTYATGSSISASTAFSSATTAAVTNAIGSSSPTFTNFSGNSLAGNMVSSNSAGAGGFGTNPFSSTGFSYGTNSAPAFGSSSSFQSAPAFGSSSSFQSAPVFGSPASFQTTISALGSSGSFPSTISAPAHGSSSGSFPSTSSAPSLFGPSSGSFPSISKTPGFGSSTSSSQSPFGVQPGFSSSFTAPAVNNDQMQEETMAEDTVNSSGFTQQPMPSPSLGGYSFPTQPAANPFPFTGQQSQAAPQNQFIFSGQQNQAAPQNANPFQATGSLEFSAGGSFSMGSSGVGGDKSGRKIYKPKRNAPRKK